MSGPGAAGAQLRLWRSCAARARFRSRSPERRAAPAGSRFSSASWARPIRRSKPTRTSGCAWAKSASCSRPCDARAIAEMVIVGAMARPEFADLRLDWGAVKRAAGLAQLFRRGDNGLLVGLAAIIEREGIRVVGAHDVAPRLVAPSRSVRRARGVAGGRNRHRARRSPPRCAVELRRGAGRGRRRRPGAGDRGGRRHRRDARPRRRDARATGGCASPVRRACW